MSIAKKKKTTTNKQTNKQKQKQKQTNCFCNSTYKIGKMVSHVGLLLDYRSSYGKYFLKWNISRLGNTADLLKVTCVILQNAICKRNISDLRTKC